MRINTSPLTILSRRRPPAGSLHGLLFTRVLSRFRLLAPISVLLTIFAVGFMPAMPTTATVPPGYLEMPLEYGEVIYRINGRSPRQLYIIGISHRDPHSGANGRTTVQTQMEIFRIGEWLKKNKRLDLLLPEGYFGNPAERAVRPSVAAGHAPRLGELDNALLLERLGATTTFVNAEMLLMEYLDFQASQVEDRAIYNAVVSSLGDVSRGRERRSTGAEAMGELQSLQELRTASLLQNIPTVIEDAFSNGAIEDRAAIFTIGLNHIKYILDSLGGDATYFDDLPDAQDDPRLANAGLNLLQSGYGITIIIPRTLANDPELLRLTRIDHITLTASNTLGRSLEE